MSTFPKPVVGDLGHIQEIPRAYCNMKERKMENKWSKNS